MNRHAITTAARLVAAVLIFSALPGCEPDKVTIGDIQTTATDGALALETTAAALRARDPDSTTARSFGDIATALTSAAEKIADAMEDGVPPSDELWATAKLQVELTPEEQRAIAYAYGIEAASGGSVPPGAATGLIGAISSQLGPWGAVAGVVATAVVGWWQRAKRKRQLAAIVTSISMGNGPADPVAASRTLKAIDPKLASEVREVRNEIGDTKDLSMVPVTATVTT